MTPLTMMAGKVINWMKKMKTTLRTAMMKRSSSDITGKEADPKLARAGRSKTVRSQWHHLQLLHKVAISNPSLIFHMHDCG